jgi:hypothetical protein
MVPSAHELAMCLLIQIAADPPPQHRDLILQEDNFDSLSRALLDVRGGEGS